MENSNTPGSWPARTAKNPVVPTTVNKNAACMIKPKRMQDHILKSTRYLSLDDAAVVPKNSVNHHALPQLTREQHVNFEWLERHLHHF